MKKNTFNLFLDISIFRPFPQHFHFQLFLEVHHEKILFFFSTQHQNSSVPPVCVLDFIFNALPFFPQH